MAVAKACTFGELLRRWRMARRLSQLELGMEAGVSSRHISFIETGRAKPSREMVIILAKVLDVPLRERNLLLHAAGYAPFYSETTREIVLEKDPATRELLNAILAYPGVPKRWSEPDFEAPQDVIIPIEMRFGDQILRLFSTITTLASPHDITLQELRIESFHTADEATVDLARSIAAQVGR